MIIRYIENPNTHNVKKDKRIDFIGIELIAEQEIVDTQLINDIKRNGVKVINDNNFDNSTVKLIVGNLL